MRGEDRFTKHPIATWLSEHSAYLMNRWEVFQAGQTAYERRMVKKAKALGLEFGKKVLWKHRRGAHHEKLNPRWDKCVFLGVRLRITELIIVDVVTRNTKYVCVAWGRRRAFLCYFAKTYDYQI